MFSNDSNVTLVVTSCGRFDLLKKTLSSFFEKNTYPIKELILIEDSGNEGVRNAIPDCAKDNIKIIINESNIGQMKSIDKAYQWVETEYIFHCEDDWEFCRSGFIEDAMSVMAERSIVTVQLRDFETDISKYYDFHSLGEAQVTSSGVSFYILLSSSSWRGFTFNPSLKRMSDYNLVGKYYRPGMSALETECFLSNFYDVHGMSTAVLKNWAVNHSGWHRHVYSLSERNEKIDLTLKTKKLKAKYILMGGILGGVISTLLTKILS